MKFYGRKLKNISNLLFELVIFIFVLYIAFTPLYYNQLTSLSVFLLYFIMIADFLMLQASIQKTILMIRKLPLLEISKDTIIHFSFFFLNKVAIDQIEKVVEDAASKKRFIYLKIKDKPTKHFFDPILKPITRQKMIDTTLVYGTYQDIYKAITQKK
ncbi:MAG: hypothetical protein AB7U79_06500 [Candidatus Izemoplasmatales bacterium]